MEEKDVEKQLKEEAAKLKNKDFSERWEVIKDKIHPSAEEMRGEVLSEQKVFTTTSGSRSERGVAKKKLILYSGLVVLVIAVCLAIALPLTLRKPQERFLGLADLDRKNVSESEFNTAIENSDIQIINLSNYELDMLYILTTENSTVLGGGAEVIDFETDSYNKLVFYSAKVTSDFEISNDSEIYNVNNVKIKYITTAGEDYYTTVAIADSGAVIYELNCMTVDENVTAVFDRLFGNG
ncbi:MAG: hypothetical protein K2N50_00990 [Clostridia bacterium]|nr:hypothetical protein [Clostridia bacterium]